MMGPPDTVVQLRLIANLFKETFTLQVDVCGGIINLKNQSDCTHKLVGLGDLGKLSEPYLREQRQKFPFSFF